MSPEADNRRKEYRGYLKDEYLMLVNQYEDFDRRALTIKSWMMAGTVAGFAVQSQNAGLDRVVLAGLILVLALSVWTIEAIWKMFQQALGGRIQTIEYHFRIEPPESVGDLIPLQSFGFWQTFFHYNPNPMYPREVWDNDGKPKNLRKVWRFMRALFLPQVFIPYLPIVIMAVIALWLAIQRLS